MELRSNLPLNGAFTYANRRGNHNEFWLRFPCLPIEAHFAVWSDAHDRTKLALRSLGLYSPETTYRGRTKVVTDAWQVEDGDALCQVLFGNTSLQAFYRHMRHYKLWAVDRGKRGGKWWCEIADLPLEMIPRRRSRHRWGRIGLPYLWIFESMIERQQPDFAALDLGPDRLPPVWVCNLCGRTAPRECWTWRTPPGLANSYYITGCPSCGGRSNTNDFGALVDRLKGEGFIPRMRMQDDYVFTL